MVTEGLFRTDVPKYERDDAVDPFVSNGVELSEEETRRHRFGVQRSINHAAFFVVFRGQEIQRFRQSLQLSTGDKNKENYR